MKAAAKAAVLQALQKMDLQQAIFGYLEEQLIAYRDVVHQARR
jgi:hypothetical protein